MKSDSSLIFQIKQGIEVCEILNRNIRLMLMQEIEALTN